MIISNNGYVGIGIAAPAAEFHVYEAADPTVILDHGNANGLFLLDFAEAGTSNARIVQLGSTYTTVARRNNLEIGNLTAAGNIRFTTTASETTRIQIDGASGAVSVGTTTAPTGGLKVQGPAAQTIAAGETIAADACGSLKEVTAGSAVTTSTTDTITAPADANDSCCMDIYNVGTTNTITLDQNANNNLAADTALGPCDSIRACSNGARWVFNAVYAGTCN